VPLWYIIKQMARKLPEYSYRTSRKKEEQIIYRRIGVVVVTTVVILAALFFWGPTFINSVGQLVGGRTDTDNQDNSDSQNEFVAGPHLEVLPVATNSAFLDVRGYARPNQQVELTNNDSFVGKLDTKEDGTFIFERVQLREADNSLKAVLIDGDNRSQAALASIRYDKTPPKLEVYEPVQNLLVGSTINVIRVRGKTEADSTVTVNGTQAVLDNTNNFDTTISITPGDNRVKITSTDSAGNQTNIERTVTSQ
jgi:hypothetical protein